MAGDLLVTDKLGVDFKLLKALILHYTKQEGVIKWQTWEKIIARACDGVWIPGDKYMADAVKNQYGLNIKSVLRDYTKRQHVQTLDYVQCRVPIVNEFNLTDQEIGEEIIKTLVAKREESFNDLNVSEMIDVIIIHNRQDDYYNVRIFFSNQPHYESYTYDWKDQCGYIIGEDKWKLKRNPSDEYGQTRLSIKNSFSLSDCDVDFSLYCPVVNDPTDEELITQYEEYVTEIQTKH